MLAIRRFGGAGATRWAFAARGAFRWGGACAPTRFALPTTVATTAERPCLSIGIGTDSPATLRGGTTVAPIIAPDSSHPRTPGSGTIWRPFAATVPRP